MSWTGMSFPFTTQIQSKWWHFTVHWSMTLKIGALTKLGLFFPVVCFIYAFDQASAEQVSQMFQRFLFLFPTISSPSLSFLIPVDFVFTRAAVPTRLAAALINFLLTVYAGVSRSTVTRVVIHVVNTCRAVFAGSRCTLVDVLFAFLSSVTWPAKTLERGEFVDTCRSVLTWAAGTFVCLSFTVFSWKY